MKALLKENYDGINPLYFVQNEVVNLTGFTNGIIKLDYGSFYKDGLVVKDSRGVNLDYRLANLDALATKLSGREVYRTIILEQPTDSLKVSYYAVGGKHLTGAELLREMYESGFGENNGISWDDVVNKPTHFPVKEHEHHAKDLYGFDGIIDELNTVNQLSTTNVNLLNQELAETNEAIKAMTSALANSSNELLEREFEKNKHQDGEIVYLDRWLNANDVIGGGTWSRLASRNGPLLPSSGGDGTLMMSSIIGGVPTHSVSAWVKNSSVPTPSASTLSIVGGLKGQTLVETNPNIITNINDSYVIQLTYTGSEPSLTVGWRVVNKTDRKVVSNALFRGWRQDTRGGTVLTDTITLTPSTPVQIELLPTKNRMDGNDDVVFLIDGYIKTHTINLNKTNAAKSPSWKAYSDYQCTREITECHEGDTIFLKKDGVADDKQYVVNWAYSGVPYTEVLTTSNRLSGNSVNRWVVGLNKVNGEDRLLNVFITEDNDLASVMPTDEQFNLSVKVRDRSKPVNVVIGIDYTTAGSPIGLSIGDGGLNKTYSLEVRVDSQHNAPKEITAGNAIAFVIEPTTKYANGENNLITTVLVRDKESNEVVVSEQFALRNTYSTQPAQISIVTLDKSTEVETLDEGSEYYLVITDSVSSPRRVTLSVSDELDIKTAYTTLADQQILTNTNTNNYTFENGKTYIRFRTIADEFLNTREKVLKLTMLIDGVVDAVVRQYKINDTSVPHYTLTWYGLENGKLREQATNGDIHQPTLNINHSAGTVKRIKVVSSSPEDIEPTTPYFDLNGSYFNVRFSANRDLTVEDDEVVTFDVYAVINGEEFKWFTTSPMTIMDTSKPVALKACLDRVGNSLLTDYTLDEHDEVKVWMILPTDNTVSISRYVFELTKEDGSPVTNFKPTVEQINTGHLRGYNSYSGDFVIRPVYTGLPNDARPDKVVLKVTAYTGRDYMLVDTYKFPFNINKTVAPLPTLNPIIYRQNDSSRTPVTSIDEGHNYVYRLELSGRFPNTGIVLSDIDKANPYHTKLVGGVESLGAKSTNNNLNLDRKVEPQIFLGQLLTMHYIGLSNSSTTHIIERTFQMVKGRKTWAVPKNLSLTTSLVKYPDGGFKPTVFEDNIALTANREYSLVNTSKTLEIELTQVAEMRINEVTAFTAKLINATVGDRYIIRLASDSPYKGSISHVNSSDFLIQNVNQTISYQIRVVGIAATRPDENIKLEMVNATIDEVVGTFETVLKQATDLTAIDFEFVTSETNVGDSHPRKTSLFIDATDHLRVTVRNIDWYNDRPYIDHIAGRPLDKFKTAFTNRVEVSDNARNATINIPITPIEKDGYNPATDDFVELALKTPGSKLEKRLRIPIIHSQGLSNLEYKGNVYFEQNGKEVDFLTGGSTYWVVVKNVVLKRLGTRRTHVEVHGFPTEDGGKTSRRFEIDRSLANTTRDFRFEVSIPNRPPSNKTDVYWLQLDVATNSTVDYELGGRSKDHPVTYIDITPAINDVYISLANTIDAVPLSSINEGTTYYLHVKAEGLEKLISGDDKSRANIDIRFTDNVLSLDHYRFNPALNTITSVTARQQADGSYWGVAGPYRIELDYVNNRE